MTIKMDKESRKFFETSLDDPHEVPTQDEFLVFLEKRFKALEAVGENTSTQNQLNANKQNFKKEIQKSSPN